MMEVNERIESIENCMAYAVINGSPYSEVSAMVEKRTVNFDIPRDLIRAALKNGWSKGAEQRCKAQPINDGESTAIRNLYIAAGFRDGEMPATAGYLAAVVSYVIWSVLHDQIDPYKGPISFNLQSGEIPVFGLANVLVSEQRTVTSYVGGYAGATILAGWTTTTGAIPATPQVCGWVDDSQNLLSPGPAAGWNQICACTSILTFTTTSVNQTMYLRAMMAAASAFGTPALNSGGPLLPVVGAYLQLYGLRYG